MGIFCFVVNLISCKNDDQILAAGGISCRIRMCALTYILYIYACVYLCKYYACVMFAHFHFLVSVVTAFCTILL
jgi:hypothetical protein